MPIYEYQCSSCGELVEVLQKISDPPLTACPACGKSTLRKKVTAAAFRLKGGGWYETDFKSDKQKNLAGDRAGDGKSSDGAGDGKAGDKAAGDTSGKDAGSGTGTTGGAAADKSAGKAGGDS